MDNDFTLLTSDKLLNMMEGMMAEAESRFGVIPEETFGSLPLDNFTTDELIKMLNKLESEIKSRKQIDVSIEEVQDFDGSVANLGNGLGYSDKLNKFVLMLPLSITDADGDVDSADVDFIALAEMLRQIVDIQAVTLDA